MKVRPVDLLVRFAGRGPRKVLIRYEDGTQTTMLAEEEAIIFCAEDFRWSPYIYVETGPWWWTFRLEDYPGLG